MSIKMETLRGEGFQVLDNDSLNYVLVEEMARHFKK